VGGYTSGEGSHCERGPRSLNGGAASQSQQLMTNDESKAEGVPSPKPFRIKIISGGTEQILFKVGTAYAGDK